METSLVLRLVALTSLVVAAILLLAPVTGTWASCGSVLFEDKWDDLRYDYESKELEPYSFHPEGCFTALKNRRTIVIVVAAVGPIAMYGSSQIKKREDDPRKGGPPQGERQGGKQDQTSADSGRTSAGDQLSVFQKRFAAEKTAREVWLERDLHHDAQLMAKMRDRFKAKFSRRERPGTSSDSEPPE